MPAPPTDATVIFIGGVEDGRVIKGQEAQFFVMKLTPNADKSAWTASQAEIGNRIQVGASRMRDAMGVAGMDKVGELYMKYGVNERQMHMNIYELKQIDGDVFVYEHAPE